MEIVLNGVPAALIALFVWAVSAKKSAGAGRLQIVRAALNAYGLAAVLMISAARLAPKAPYPFDAFSQHNDPWNLYGWTAAALFVATRQVLKAIEAN